MNKKLLLATLAIIPLVLLLAVPARGTDNLVVNGDFEEPEVTNSSKWQVFSSDVVPGWTVEWAGEYGAPTPANLELHEGVLMPAYNGDQSVEMDTDWSSANGEPASVKIYQDIPTCVGATYELEYAWSPRPRHSDNEMEVYWGGDLVDTHSGSTSGWTLETHSGLAPAGETTRLEFIETANPDSLGMFLDAVSVEQVGECLVREAGITSPGDGDHVSGSTNFEAYLIDDDEDPVQWAVRKGTCAAGQGTVFGNVDGYNDPYAWDYNSETYTHNFSATADTCEWEPGDYCFVFNPKEDGGEADIRLTREFVVEDCDGVPYTEDICPATVAETLDVRLGKNRWIWNGDEWVKGEIPGKGKGPKKSFNMEDTQGCSCEQILDWLHDYDPEEYGEMKGHRKFGCSSSVIEEFIELASQ